MAWGKSEEEKQAERDERARAQQAAELARQQQWQAQAQAKAAAEFAASPFGRAVAAYQAGKSFFQLELEVSSLTGGTSFFGSSGNTVAHSSVAMDVLASVESAGWRLENVGYVFIETGSTSTDRVLNTGQGTVTEGNVTGIYLFRRVT